MATRRLMKERSSLEKDPLDYCVSIVLPDEQDLYRWNATILGPPNTPYAGGMFVLSLDFPTTYPFKAPVLRFLTKLYHPSVSLKTGELCAALLGEWGPTLNVRHCLTTVHEMLREPSADHPLEDDIAAMLKEKPKEFDKKAKKWTKEYAK